MTIPSSGSANPPAGGQNANTPATNPLAGGSLNLTPANSAPDGKQTANPHEGGQKDDQNATDNDAPVSMDVFREKMRSEAALRKRVQELEDRVKREDDAKLTEAERKDQEIERLKAQAAESASREQEYRLRFAVDERVRERGLQDTEAVTILLKALYGDQIDYDEQKVPQNAGYFVDRLVEKFTWLVKQPETPSPPSAGRNVSPQRNPTGQQYTNKTPTPPEQWSRLGNFDWSKADEKR